jgi:hypothetical protein
MSLVGPPSGDPQPLKPRPWSTSGGALFPDDRIRATARSMRSWRSTVFTLGGSRNRTAGREARSLWPLCAVKRGDHHIHLDVVNLLAEPLILSALRIAWLLDRRPREES